MMAAGFLRARVLLLEGQALTHLHGLSPGPVPAASTVVELLLARLTPSTSFSASSLGFGGFRAEGGNSSVRNPAARHFPGSHLCPMDTRLASKSRTTVLPNPGVGIGRGGAANFSRKASPSSDAKTAEDVLQFWFKDVGEESGVYMKSDWFVGGPDFDKLIEENFGETLALASTGALNGWLNTPRGRLALVIVLDQFSRNLYRNSSASFSQDESARKITLDTVEQGLDKEMKPWERKLFYLPLMHSESIGDHETADRLYQQLADEYSHDEKLHEDLLNSLEFERSHSAVIKKFGRYPSRNAVLGRQSTKEEEEFLASGVGW